MVTDNSQKIETYKQIDGVETIVQQLVDNIYNDDCYQDYLKDLEENDSDASTKKALAIKKTFLNIKAFNSNAEPLFLLNEIGTILGVSNAKIMTKSYTSTERVTGYIVEKGKHIKKTFLTKHGVYRIIFNNKTKLSEVFRGFIYKLIDHMFNHEIETLKSIINEYVNENPQLVNESLVELETNVKKYKELYEDEKKEKLALETELSVGEMYIEQLKLDKSNILGRLDDRNMDKNLDEINQALEIMKKKYLKEFTISLVGLNTIDAIFSDGSIYEIEDEIYTLDNYKKLYPIILETFDKSIGVSEFEIFYLSLNYGSVVKDDNKSQVNTRINTHAKSYRITKDRLAAKKEAKSSDDDDDSCKKYNCPDFFHVVSEYISDRSAFNELIEILKEECDSYQISKNKKSSTNFVFKTSIEHIKLVARNLLLKS